MHEVSTEYLAKWLAERYGAVVWEEQSDATQAHWRSEATATREAFKRSQIAERRSQPVGKRRTACYACDVEAWHDTVDEMREWTTNHQLKNHGRPLQAAPGGA